MTTQLVTAGFSTQAEWPYGTRNIQSIVMHDLEGSTQGAINWWNTNGQSSAHYIISKDGSIVQCVKDEDIAWHAGTNVANGRTAFWKTNNINTNSIGIELEGYTTTPYTPEQYKSLIDLGAWLCQYYNILVEHTFNQISGWHTHSEISNQRSDPGPYFNMQITLLAIKGRLGQ